MKIKALKLGTVCIDIATKLEGTLTHWVLDMDENIAYIFQPKGLADDGRPVKKHVLGLARLKVKPSDFEEVEVPFEILGSTVTANASGFTGMAVEFVRHINGCFHVTIQPAGVNKTTKTPVDKLDFDLRECTGPKIAKLSEPELKESKRERPSPTGDTFGDGMPASIRAAGRSF